MADPTKIYYVYALLDTRYIDTTMTKYNYKLSDSTLVRLCAKPFYIGKGKNERFVDHYKELSKIEDVSLLKKHINYPCTNRYKLLTMNKLTTIGLSAYSQKIFVRLTENQAWDYEKELITLIGIDNLTNIREGGEGGALSSESKEKISKGKLGKKMSNEARKKMSQAKKGEKNNMYGRNDQCFTPNGIASISSKIRKGKTNVEIYGTEKALSISKKRSKTVEGIGNHRFIKGIDFETLLYDYVFSNQLLKDLVDPLEITVSGFWHRLKKINFSKKLFLKDNKTIKDLDPYIDKIKELGW